MIQCDNEIKHYRINAFQHCRIKLFTHSVIQNSFIIIIAFKHFII